MRVTDTPEDAKIETLERRLRVAIRRAKALTAGAFAIGAVLGGLIVAAVWSTVESVRQPIVYGKVRMVDHQSSTADNSPSTVNGVPSIVDDEPRFVASSIKNLYHLPGCQYVQRMEHQVGYSSEEAAAKDGKRPCSRCIETQISLK